MVAEKKAKVLEKKVQAQKGKMPKAKGKTVEHKEKKVSAKEGVAEKKSGQKVVAKKELKLEPVKDKAVLLKGYETVLHPLVTEKAIGLIESENKLVFVVRPDSKKDEIKRAVENLYTIKVDKVNVLRDTKGRKRAFVKINKQFRADEIATRLGVL